MSTGLDLYDLPFHNASGETIPGYAVMQQTWEGVIADRDYFRAIKPNGQGKKFAVNGPLPIPPGSQGRGTAARGVFALHDPNISPTADEELGPTPGTWFLSRLGSGFLVDGELAGSPPSAPGFPTQASTKRVRVTQVSAAPKATQLVRFELKIDKNLPSPPFGEAYLLDGNDAKLTGDNGQLIEIIVIDRLPTRYAGFGPYEDKKFGAQPGNRGWAQFLDGDYGGTGKLGYEIIDMDGQARWLQGKIADDWPTSNQTGEIEVDNYWGAAPNNRPPKTREKDYGGGGTGAPSDKRNIVDIKDPLKIRTGTVKKDAIVLALFDELRNQYILSSATAADSPFQLGWINKDIPGASFNYQALTGSLGIAQDAVILMEASDSSISPKLLQGQQIKLYGVNCSTTKIRASTDEPILMWGIRKSMAVGGSNVDAFCPAAPFDIRQLPNFSRPTKQAVYHKGASGEAELGGKDCPP